LSSASIHLDHAPANRVLTVKLPLPVLAEINTTTPTINIIASNNNNHNNKLITVVCSLADSYVDASVRDAGSAAELAALRKIDRYSALEKTHFFQPIAVESLGPMNIAAYSFLAEL